MNQWPKDLLFAATAVVLILLAAGLLGKIAYWVMT
jgi:hypothetical protein